MELIAKLTELELGLELMCPDLLLNSKGAIDLPGMLLCRAGQR
ncbi:MAG TPA: hypothetical protein VLA19_13060 [Herpetosiphonaceae bacterium]|nr:hypothetical protein [Herpetosiphonaceae bacterium]